MDTSTPRSRKNRRKGPSLAALVDVPAEPSICAGRNVMVCFRSTVGDMVFLGLNLDFQGTRATNDDAGWSAVWISVHVLLVKIPGIKVRKCNCRSYVERG